MKNFVLGLAAAFLVGCLIIIVMISIFPRVHRESGYVDQTAPAGRRHSN